MVNKLSETEIAALAAEWHAHGAPSHEQNMQWIKDAHDDVPGAISYADQQLVSREMYALKRLQAIEAFDTTPSIKAHMIEHVRSRGSKAPEADDFTTFFERARDNKHSGFGKALPAYVPEKGACGVKLQPAKAVRFFYSQESYSDDSKVAVPFTIDESKPHNLATFFLNVSNLVRRADTHNGFAGSGANWSASIHDGFVVIHCRSSISD